MGLSGRLYAPVAVTSKKNPVIHRVAGWVGPRACPDAVKKLTASCLYGDAAYVLCIWQPSQNILLIVPAMNNNTLNVEKNTP